MAAATLALLLWVATQVRPTPPAPGRTPPFALGTLEAEGRDGGPTLLVVGRPGALLYVDDTCLFCSQEVRRWVAATHGVAPPWLTVVRHPAGTAPDPGFIPHAWAPRTLVDRRGAIGAALGVTAVPFLARTDTLGTVVEVSMGLSPPERIKALIQAMEKPAGKRNRP